MKNSFVIAASALSLLFQPEYGWAQKATLCESGFEQAKTDSASELTCTTDIEDGSPIVWIRYGCDDGNGGFNNVTISSNVQCTGFVEQSKNTTEEWICGAFADEFDFSEFVQEAEAINITCASSGQAPVFTYEWTAQYTTTDACPAAEGASSIALTPATSEAFNETLASNVISFAIYSEVNIGCSSSGGGGSEPASSTLCESMFEQAKTDSASELTCTEIEDGSPLVWIRYSCGDGGFNNVTITSNVQCKGFVEQSKNATAEWICGAFADDFDFSGFVEEAEASEITCASGKAPVFTYEWTAQEDTMDACNPSQAASSISLTPATSEAFNETLANDAFSTTTSFEFNPGCSSSGGSEPPQGDTPTAAPITTGEGSTPSAAPVGVFAASGAPPVLGLSMIFIAMASSSSMFFSL